LSSDNSVARKIQGFSTIFVSFSTSDEVVLQAPACASVLKEDAVQFSALPSAADGQLIVGWNLQESSNLHVPLEMQDASGEAVHDDSAASQYWTRPPLLAPDAPNTGDDEDAAASEGSNRRDAAYFSSLPSVVSWYVQVPLELEFARLERMWSEQVKPRAMADYEVLSCVASSAAASSGATAVSNIRVAGPGGSVVPRGLPGTAQEALPHTPSAVEPGTVVPVGEQDNAQDNMQGTFLSTYEKCELQRRSLAHCQQLALLNEELAETMQVDAEEKLKTKIQAPEKVATVNTQDLQSVGIEDAQRLERLSRQAGAMEEMVQAGTSLDAQKTQSTIQALEETLGEVETQRASLKTLDTLRCGFEDGQVDDVEFREYLAALQSIRFGALRVRVHGVVLNNKGVAKPYKVINGVYERSEEVVNGRAVYFKANKSHTAMWWANNDGKVCWCVGPTGKVGKKGMWAYVESVGFGPEEASTRAWTVYNYGSASWEEQIGVEVSNLDPPDDLESTEEDHVEHGEADEFSAGVATAKAKGSLVIAAAKGSLVTCADRPASMREGSVRMARSLTPRETNAQRVIERHVINRPHTPQPPPPPAQPTQTRLDCAGLQRVDNWIKVKGDVNDDNDDKAHAYMVANVSNMYSAARVRVSGVTLHCDGVLKAFAGINGDYQRSDGVSNGRAVYLHLHMATAMWFANNDDQFSWCIGPNDQVGTDTMWAYVESMGFGPDEAGARKWNVYSYERQSWEQQTGVEVLNLDPPEPEFVQPEPPAQPPQAHSTDIERQGTMDEGEFGAYLASHAVSRYGPSIVRITGVSVDPAAPLAMPFAGINGDFQRSDQICNGRAVYMHVSSPTALWMSNNDGKICWCVGPTIMAGSDMMWGYVESKGFGPEEAGRRAWNIFSYISQSWETQTSVEVLNLNEAEVEVKDTVTPLAQMVENMVTAHVRSRPHSVQAAEANAEPVHVWPFGVGLNVVADDDGVYRVSGMNALSAAEVSGLIEVVYI